MIYWKQNWAKSLKKCWGAGTAGHTCQSFLCFHCGKSEKFCFKLLISSLHEFSDALKILDCFKDSDLFITTRIMFFSHLVEEEKYKECQKVERCSKLWLTGRGADYFVTLKSHTSCSLEEAWRNLTSYSRRVWSKKDSQLGNRLPLKKAFYTVFIAVTRYWHVQCGLLQITKS